MPAAPIGSFGIHLYCATVVPRAGRIKRKGVELWRRRRRARRINRRAREPRLDHRDFDVAKRPNECSAVWLSCYHQHWAHGLILGQQEMEPRAAIAYARRGAADRGEYRQAARRAKGN